MVIGHLPVYHIYYNISKDCFDAVAFCYSSHTFFHIAKIIFSVVSDSDNTLYMKQVNILNVYQVKYEFIYVDYVESLKCLYMKL